MPFRPLIAVTRPHLEKKKDYNFKHFKFFFSLLNARVIRVSPDQEVNLNHCDGLLLSGGADIHPSHYGQAERPHFRHMVDRDAMEIELFHQFKDKNKPIMGVCRGMQMINVCLGGTLYQEISEQFSDTQYPKTYPKKYLYRKPTTIKPASRLFSIIQKDQIMVNSMHHQAVNKLGKGLKVSAMEPKGIIQAIEHETIPHIFGVQWHPELMHFQIEQWKIFNHFVKLCR